MAHPTCRFLSPNSCIRLTSRIAVIPVRAATHPKKWTPRSCPTPRLAVQLIDSPLQRSLLCQFNEQDTVRPLQEQHRTVSAFSNETTVVTERPSIYFKSVLDSRNFYCVQRTVCL